MRPDGTRTFSAPDSALVFESLFQRRSAFERTPKAPSCTFHGPPVAASAVVVGAADVRRAGVGAAAVRIGARLLIVGLGAVTAAGAGSGSDETTTASLLRGVEAITGAAGSASGTRAADGTAVFDWPLPSATEANCDARLASFSCFNWRASNCAS